MRQAQINVRTRACSRTSIARTKQAALTHNGSIEKRVIISIIVNENFEPGFLAFSFSVLSAFKRA